MTLECPTIVVFIFTSSEMVPEIDSLQSVSPLHVKVLEFEELDTVEIMEDVLAGTSQHSIDPEAFRHSPELYAVWAQKVVSRAAKENPFNTEYFMWTDIRAFRTPIPDLMRKTYPTSQHFRDDKKVFFSSVVFFGHQRVS